MNLVKWSAWLLGSCLSLSLSLRAQEFSFQVPEQAGTLRLGLVSGEKSVWANECRIRKTTVDSFTFYSFKHSLLGKGELQLRYRPLRDSRGAVMEIEAIGVPGGVELFWAFGGASGQLHPSQPSSGICPEDCQDNVFSIERTAFTVYYGTSRKLRIFHVLTPLASEIRLSDARQQQSPLHFHRSGKKTDAPALTALCPLENGQKIYFCFYKQNPKADYNYFMLPQLFRQGSLIQHNETDWMKSTPD